MKIGIIGYYCSLILTLVLWGMAKFIAPVENVVTAIVQVAGLLGIMLLSWTYLLSTRTRWIEKLFGGLDKAYYLHHLSGGLAFVALANHVAFLILSAIPRDMTAIYLLPGRNLSYNLGQLSFYLMLILLALTLYANLPYRLWKWTHEWMGIVIMLGGLHSILVGSDNSQFLPLGIWIAGWSMLATLAYLYKRFIYYIYPLPVMYKLTISGSTGELVVIALEAEKNPINFGPGQYGFFALPSRLRDEHAFSVLSQQKNKLVLGVKVYGNFTKTLKALPRGSKLLVRGPFGKFAEKIDSPHLVFIAGGIGITPFLSMVRSLNPRQKAEMFFSAKQMPHNTLISPFEKEAQENPNFRFFKNETGKNVRLTAKQILVETGNDKEAHYFLCGPSKMMEQIAEDMHKLGIKRSHIVYEDFAFK